MVLKLIQPYTRIRIPFVSKELNIPEADVEQLLVSLILDGRIDGLIDQVHQRLELTKPYVAMRMLLRRSSSDIGLNWHMALGGGAPLRTQVRERQAVHRGGPLDQAAGPHHDVGDQPRRMKRCSPAIFVQSHPVFASRACIYLFYRAKRT